VDVGELEVVGRSVHGDATCVIGQTCRIDAIVSVSASDNDRFMVLQTCGTDALVPGFPASGVGVAASSGAAVAWGSELVTVFAGTYRLCWCADQHHSCSQAEEFDIDVLGLRLVGPSLVSDGRTCVAGQTCLIDGIRGVDLSDSDTIMVLETCGTRTAVSGMMSTGIFTTDRSGASVEFGSSSVVTAAGGQYRLCWCAGGFDCAIAERYVKDIGQLTIRGPNVEDDPPPSNPRTCVAGQTCAIDSILGHLLSTDDRVLILETCGVPSRPSITTAVDSRWDASLLRTSGLAQA
jgi:hypothetical protein